MLKRKKKYSCRCVRALTRRVLPAASLCPYRGRRTEAGQTTYQAYGPTSSFCNFSVSRWALNKVLMDAAEAAGCHLHFRHPLQHVEVDTGTLFFYLWDPAATAAGFQKSVVAAHVFGADGGGSRCRQALVGFLARQAAAHTCAAAPDAAPSAGASATESFPAVRDVYQPLGYGYKELRLPALPAPALASALAGGGGGGYALHPTSLHIWPRGSHFLMGLANLDGSFTMTLYMDEAPHADGRPSFAQLATRPQVEAFFATHYASALQLMPSCVDDFLANPVGRLGTVFVQPWAVGGTFALIGDAAHAFTPFFGQGCNSGFEDVTVSAKATRYTGLFSLGVASN